MIRTVLVDDDDAARRYLRALLNEAHTDVEVVGEASNITDAQTLIGAQRPQLVFLDVEMPGGSGFDLLMRMHPWDFSVIFTTSHQHYAIQAIRFSALDYLPKPVLPEELAEAMVRFREQVVVGEQREERHSAFIANLAQPEPKHFKLTIPHGDRTLFIPTNEVLRCEAERNYTWVHLADGGRYLMTRTLKEFEEMLAPLGFVRISRSDLVQKATIAHIEPGHVVLKDGIRMEVSRRRMAEVKELLAR
jgi:two-component system, LytTR family, response regulator